MPWFWRLRCQSTRLRRALPCVWNPRPRKARTAGPRLPAYFRRGFRRRSMAARRPYDFELVDRLHSAWVVGEDKLLVTSWTTKRLFDAPFVYGEGHTFAVDT